MLNAIFLDNGHRRSKSFQLEAFGNLKHLLMRMTHTVRCDDPTIVFLLASHYYWGLGSNLEIFYFQIKATCDSAQITNGRINCILQICAFHTREVASNQVLGGPDK